VEKGHVEARGQGGGDARREENCDGGGPRKEVGGGGEKKSRHRGRAVRPKRAALELKKKRGGRRPGGRPWGGLKRAKSLEGTHLKPTDGRGERGEHVPPAKPALPQPSGKKREGLWSGLCVSGENAVLQGGPFSKNHVAPGRCRGGGKLGREPLGYKEKEKGKGFARVKRRERDLGNWKPGGLLPLKEGQVGRGGGGSFLLSRPRLTVKGRGGQPDRGPVVLKEGGTLKKKSR